MLFLGRLGRWWANRGRVLFRYDGGDRRRVGDPLRLATQLEAACPDYLERLELLNQAADSVPPGPMRADLVVQQRAAAAALVAAGRVVFELPGDERTGGLGDGEVLRVLTRFFLFMEGLADDAQIFGSSPAAV